VRKRRLISQLFLSYLGVIIAAVVLAGWYGTPIARESYLDQTAVDLEARARLCERSIDGFLEDGRTAQIDGIAKDLGKAAEMRVTVILPSGEVVGDSDEDPRHMDNHADRPEIKEALGGSTGRSTRYSASLKQNLMYVAVPVTKAGSVVAVVRTSIPVTDLNQTLRAFHRRMLLAGCVIAMLVAAVSFWISRRIAQPLKEMERVAGRFAEGELDRRLPDSNCWEISTLADAMNRMARQLDDRIRTVLRQQNELEAVLGSMQDGVLAVDNAIKYSNEGGRVRASADRDADAVTIRVQDEGCGIAATHLPRLFERFYRADKARSRELGGTGLGLAIVKHIALVHGGSVDVQSVVGRGSTFSIHLPLRSAEEDKKG